MASTIAELTKQSGFVFEGAVRRLGAVASRGLDATPEMAVVNVEKIFKGPELLSAFAGKEITVALREHERTSPGERAVFFTAGLHYGESVAVREVGRVEAAGDDVERAVHAAMRDADDEALREHLRDAALVVSGVVVEVAPAEYQRVGSEHDPDWWRFVIEVESVEKGELPPEKRTHQPAHVTGFFAHSEDVAWYRAPKVAERQRGVFILHAAGAGLRRAPGPAVLHPLDVHPHAAREHVVALLRDMR